MLVAKYLFYIGILNSLCGAVANSPVSALQQPTIRLSSPCLVVGIPPADQCNHIKDTCQEELVNSIDYLSLYYCGSHGWTILLLALMLLISFIALGLTASNFLCPNLYTISKALNLSDNVAGLTLLAFGNGAPDVLTVFKALKVGSGSLAVSELIGATFFIISVVIGAIAIFHPFKVPKFQFLLNVTFLLLVLIVVLCALLTKLTIFGCVVLILFYVLYVTIAIVSHSFLRQRSRKAMLDQRSRSNFVPTEPFLELQETLDSEFPTIEELAEEDENINSHANIPGSYGLKLLLNDLSKHANTNRNLLLDNLLPESSLQDHSIHEDSNNDNDDTTTNRLFAPYHDDLENVDYEPQFDTTNVYIKFLFVLLPSLKEIQKSNLLYKFYYIATLPIGFILNISIPVRDETHIEMLKAKVTNAHIGGNFNFDFDSFILAIQTYFGTVMLAYVSFGGLSTFWTFVFPLTIVSATALSGLVFLSYKVEFNSSSIVLWKTIAYSTSVLGFMVSIAWISLFATEIINILKSISVIFDLSDEILGLTVFTIGNSLADFISNITIARMGMPLMAYGACFGGPLISLSSLGFSGSIIIPNSGFDSYTFDVNITILITSIFLVGNIFMLLYAVPHNNWMIDRKIGTILVSSWAFSTLINIIIESF